MTLGGDVLMPSVPMPRLSDSMEEGTIVQWLVEDGDEVTRGQELVEIETDKATMVCDAAADGPVRILVRAGETRPIGEIIAVIGSDPDAGDDVDASSDSASMLARDSAAVIPVATSVESSRQKATPVARRIAREAGIALETLTGSGPGGRILRANVVATLERGPAAAQEPRDGIGSRVRQAGTSDLKGAIETVDLTRVQRTIARRMAESNSAVPTSPSPSPSI